MTKLICRAISRLCYKLCTSNADTLATQLAGRQFAKRHSICCKLFYRHCPLTAWLEHRRPCSDAVNGDRFAEIEDYEIRSLSDI